MNNRTPTKILPNGAIRYGVYDEAGNLLRYEYIKPEDMPTQEGTPLNKATLFSDAAATVCGLPTTATPNDGFVELGKRTSKGLARDLQIMLNLSLGTSNIDAWADLFDNNSQINSSNSTAYTLVNGRLSGGKYDSKIENLNSSYSENFGNSSSSYVVKVGQTFMSTFTGKLSSITVQLSKSGSPIDSVIVKVYNEDKSTLLGSSTNTIPASSIDVSRNDFVRGQRI